MPSVVLIVGAVLIAALIVRHSGSRGEMRTLAIVGGLALGLRVVAIAIVYAIATRVHGEGTWLADEASYFLATEALMPWPWDKSLPPGLDHLAGNGYLGLTSAISLLVGSVNSTAFRLANGVLGTVVVLLCALVAQSLFGGRAGLLAGLAAAAWPDLILWSATFVRDTLASLAVIALWWALVVAKRQSTLLTVPLVLFAIVLLATLRDYLAILAGLGTAAWVAYPFVRRHGARTIAWASTALVGAVAVLAVAQPGMIDKTLHSLFYRQVVTRMETMGRLYRDPPPPDELVQLPFRPGAVIAIADPRTGWLMTGIVTDSSQPGFVSVDLTDDTSRVVPISDVELLQDVRVPRLEMLSWVLPSMGSVLLGLPDAGEEANVAWVGAALAWDVLVVLATYGLLRNNVDARNWIYPMCITVGTVVTLLAIPGAPGNAERHRATQTVPLLVVLASGVAVSRARSSAPDGRAVINATRMPSRATTASASVRRSDL